MSSRKRLGSGMGVRTRASRTPRFRYFRRPVAECRPPPVRRARDTRPARTRKKKWSGGRRTVPRALDRRIVDASESPCQWGSEQKIPLIPSIILKISKTSKSPNLPLFSGARTDVATGSSHRPNMHGCERFRTRRLDLSVRYVSVWRRFAGRTEDDDGSGPALGADRPAWTTDRSAFFFSVLRRTAFFETPRRSPPFLFRPFYRPPLATHEPRSGPGSHDAPSRRRLRIFRRAVDSDGGGSLRSAPV
jgi:hypothetical protein